MINKLKKDKNFGTQSRHRNYSW